MSSPTSTQIVFDNTSGQFTPGDRIIGKVILVVHRDKPILGIDMRLIGKAKVTCIHIDKQCARRGHKRLSSRSCDKYFIINESKSLHREGTNEFVEEQRLPVGIYEYPFSWTLPENIPASFEGPYGWIRYRMEIIIRHSQFWDHRCEAESEFYVTGYSDLNNLDDRIYRQVQVETKFIHVYNCYGSNYLELTFELERRAYVPGESIRFAATVDFVNRTGHPPISGVRVTLVQEQTYRIKDTVKIYCAKIQEVVGPMIFPNAIEVWNGEMTLLPITPTALGGACRIINIEYYLRAQLGISEEDKVDIGMKLQIGTVRLRMRPQIMAIEDELNNASQILRRPETDYEHSPSTMSNANGLAMDFLSVIPGPSRRGSAPPLFEIYNQPIAGPSSASAPVSDNSDEPETPPPSYCDAVFLGSVGFLDQPTENDEPPAYPRQAPFFLRKGAKHLFDSNNVYSTL